jgi:hypothetical protein
VTGVHERRDGHCSDGVFVNGDELRKQIRGLSELGSVGPVGIP